MLLAYVAFQDGTKDYAKLCLIANEPHTHAIPVNVDLLFSTDAAVFWVGPKEAVVVEFSEDGNSKIIRPAPPSIIFLTPDNPSSPGIRAAMVKIEYPEAGLYNVSFRKELAQDWQPWNPVQQVR